ncbi:MAG: D-sedoheptulose 7-phosphate isomerase [Candidatus Auribacterota bacterium]|jgi:D-sedoheptulose 7-phosphate isomerase|uniref:Phosphoheptose isomerase n=1 Tax=Candidatus Auribacter fodinae TaxID=2093366 RepID=A0A3A4R736_9BACT|nr:MAG: SIS domain-containing protein [Candidatus Auribacter fodinae]
MRSYIESYISDGVELRKQVLRECSITIELIGQELYKVLQRGNKILICGNGGSAADAQHIAAELVNRYRVERSPLPAIALTTDTSVITAIGNDYSFKEIFSKQVRALAREGDCLIAISTSGTSPNIIHAIKSARKAGCVVISLTGNDGGEMPSLSDISLIIPSSSTPLIQEMHLMVEHLMCDIVEKLLLQNVFER